jgi:hypothetical protein
MSERPLYVTVVGWIFIIAGVVGFAYHFEEWQGARGTLYEWLFVEVVRLLAIVAGAFLLKRKNWARFLVIAWMAFHVVLSAFHDLFEFGMHALLLAILLYLLFRPAANRYFRPGVNDRV